MQMLKKTQLFKYNKNGTMVKIFFTSYRKDFLYIYIYMCGLWIWIWFSYSFEIITSPSCVLASPSSFPAAEHGHSFFFPLRVLFSPFGAMSVSKEASSPLV